MIRNRLSAALLLALCCLASLSTTSAGANDLPEAHRLPLLAADQPVSLTVAVYNQAGVNALVTTLAPYVRPEDSFLLISGNNAKPLDLAWLNRAAAALAARFPDNRVLVGTAGLANFNLAAQGVQSPIDEIVYIYEPNMANEPEFSWDFEATLAHVDEAAAMAHGHPLAAGVKPTGRPLLQAYLFKYAWDYGRLGQRVDRTYVQTQTYCKKNPETFGAAAAELVAQFGAPGAAWSMEISLDPESVNGVYADQALACARAAQSWNVSRFLMWWSPPYAAEAAAFMAGLGR
ncbi:MAG TPA: hypothetical protein VNN21_03105 [Dehalococcoidia bacterium]|nr:hypothetical protein [Dehalococcoidia bacterium]